MAQAKTESVPGAKDAITFLAEARRNVKTMFTDFNKLTKSKDSDEEKGALVRKICDALTVERSSIPQFVRRSTSDDLVDEADVEHAGAKELNAQLEEMEPGDDHYDAKATVLGAALRC